MGRFQNELFREMEQYGDDYRRSLSEEKKVLEEKHDRLFDQLCEEEGELMRKAKGELNNAELASINEKIEKLDEDYEKTGHELGRLEIKKEDLDLLDKIETKLKPQSEYWAEHYKTTLKRLNEKEDKNEKKKNEFEKNGKPYVGPSGPNIMKRQSLDTKIEMASMDITPDALNEMTEDYYAAQRFDSGYFEAKDKLGEILDKTSFEEADMILEQGKEEGKYTKKEYDSLKTILRRHYKK